MPLVTHFQRLPIEAYAVAHGASDKQVGQKVHFDFIESLSLTFLAASAFDVKADPARFETALLGFPRGGENLSNFVVHADVRGGVAARRAANRRLIDDDNLVDL